MSPDTDRGAELPVPDEVAVKLYAAVSAAMSSRHDFGERARWEHPDSAEAHVRAIAAPVVAAELRRLADEYEETARGDVLRARADQLDG